MAVFVDVAGLHGRLHIGHPVLFAAHDVQHGLERVLKVVLEGKLALLCLKVMLHAQVRLRNRRNKKEAKEAKEAKEGKEEEKQRKEGK